MTKRELIIDIAVWIAYFLLCNGLFQLPSDKENHGMYQLGALCITLLFTGNGIHKAVSKYRKHNQPDHRCPLCHCLLHPADDTMVTHTGFRFEVAHTICVAKKEKKD